MAPQVRAADAVKAAAAAVFFAVMAALYTWPLPLHLAHAVPHDSGDPLLVTWLLWWSTHVTPLTDRWWNAPAFYPSHGVFAFSETLLGLAPIAAPLLRLGAPPLAAYNTAFIASFFLSGLAAYFLGFVLTRQHGAALVSGVAFAFSPYRVAHLNHLQLLAAFWMPIAVAALHLYSAAGRARWAVVFAAAWLLQALTSGYYFFLFSLLVAGWLACFARRWPARRLAVAGVCWLVAALLMLPLLAGYRRIQDAYGFRRVPSEIAYYSADIAGIVSAAPESRLWHRLHAAGNPESQLFPGATILLLLAIGLDGIFVRDDRTGKAAAGSPRRLFAFYAISAVALWLLSLGPSPAFKGQPIGIAGPYRALMMLPGFNGIRVPARLWMIATLCLAAASAIVVSRLKSSRVRAFAVAVSVAGLLADGWPLPLALGADPGMQVTHSDAVARLGLPLDGNETETMYGSIAQARPVFNGYSGYTAPQYHALADLLDRGDIRIFQHLASGTPIEVVVRHRLDEEGRWRRLVASVPGARVTDVTPEWTAFRIPAGESLRSPAIGTPLPIARVEASSNEKDIGAVLDGNLDSRWHTDHQAGHETIVIDLGKIERPSTIVMSLGVYASQYPLTLQVSTSTDRAAWSVAWSGDTALEAYDAAVRAPREIPITISFAPRDARYLRLTQVGNDPRRGWSIVELEVAR